MGLDRLAVSEKRSPDPLVVFDLDGTLIDSVPLCASILNNMLIARGRPARIIDSHVRPLASGGGGALVQTLLGADGADPEADLSEFRSSYASAPTSPSALYPGVIEGLTKLAESGIRLAVCSNKPQSLCDKIIDDLNMRGLFVAVIGSRIGVPLKPETNLLTLALEQSGGAASRLVYVGDSEVDIMLAERAKIDLILVSYGYGEFNPGDVKYGVAHSFDAACDMIRSAFMSESVDADPGRYRSA